MIKPDDDEVWFNKGAALGKLGKHEEAIKCYDKALEINPDYYEALNNKGLALNKLGKYEASFRYRTLYRLQVEALKIKQSNEKNKNLEWNDLTDFDVLLKEQKAFAKSLGTLLKNIINNKQSMNVEELREVIDDFVVKLYWMNDIRMRYKAHLSKGLEKVSKGLEKVSKGLEKLKIRNQ